MVDLSLDRPIVPILLAIFAVWAARLEARSWLRAVLILGAILAAGSWLPVVLGSMLDPDGSAIGNGLGLGLLAVYGSFLGVALCAVGLGIRLMKIVLDRS
jgi:hypothetical protein